MSIFDKNRALVSVPMQMILVIVTFAIMGVFSFIFVSNIERGHLIKDAENALAISEHEITTILLEAENFFNGYSEALHDMVINSASSEEVVSFLTHTSSGITNNDNEYLAGLFGVRGFFHLWGGMYISGSGRVLPEELVPQEFIWYKAAVEKNGETAVVGPYKDYLTGESVVAFSRFLFDDDGDPLGVVCVGLELKNIYKYAVDINLTESSYGLLLSNNLELLAHPGSDLIGMKLRDTASGMASLSDILEHGLNVYEYKVKNYRNEDVIVFVRTIKYGWRLGVVIPVNEYYRSVNDMAVFLSLLGGILAALLCFMLYRIAQAKKKSDLRIQQKNNFLAAMSHEIRTPLNAILGITDISMQSGTSVPYANASESFIKINNYGNLLLGIIDDILDLSNIEAGKLELMPIKYEVASLINDVVQLTSLRYESNAPKFKVEINENIPAVLVGDELRIKQILNNLLSNAFKYTEQGTVTLSLDMELVSRGGVALVMLVLQVSDTGQGMTSKQINKLFDEQTRINMAANRTSGGMGFGLTITRNLVSLMQGKMDIKSEVDKGTSVTVRIPQRTGGIGISGIIGKEFVENLRLFKLGDAVQIKKVQILYEYMPYGSVLIVDDVESNLYVAKGLMAPYGLKIETAVSGYEALDKIKNGNTYDIVFMDHMMPKMDGIETVKKLREMGYSKPIVALTANALAGHEEMFMKSGFDGFIAKPIDIRQLDFLLNKLIRDKQSVEVLEAAARTKSKLEEKLAAVTTAPQIEPELAMFFARDAEKACTALETIVRNNFHTESDIQLYVVNVHAMKSALANIGKTELSAAALKLEHAGREKDIDIMTAETHKFLDDLRDVIKEVKPKDEEEDIEDSKEALVFLREKLAIIKEACFVFDKKTVKNTLNELKEKSWSKKTKELMNSIADHLLHSEFDEVADIADSYIQTID